MPDSFSQVVVPIRTRVCVYHTISPVAAGDPVLWDVVELDADSLMDPETGRFTPDVAGAYRISAALDFDGGSLGGVILRKNGDWVAFDELLQVHHRMRLTYARARVVRVVHLNGTTDYVDAIVSPDSTASMVDDAGIYHHHFDANLVAPD